MVAFAFSSFFTGIYTFTLSISKELCLNNLSVIETPGCGIHMRPYGHQCTCSLHVCKNLKKNMDFPYYSFAGTHHLSYRFCPLMTELLE